MALLQNQALLDFLQIYGLFSLFATSCFLIYIIKNYAIHKNFFFSLKDVQNDFQEKEIENLKLLNNRLSESVDRIQKENDDLSKIIIQKIR